MTKIAKEVTTESMIERVALAIYEKRNGRGCKPWSIQTKSHKSPYLDDARAAIEAMREPTIGMLSAADDTIIPDERFHDGPFETDKFTWETMIDAILNEQES